MVNLHLQARPQSRSYPVVESTQSTRPGPLAIGLSNGTGSPSGSPTGRGPSTPDGAGAPCAPYEVSRVAAAAALYGHAHLPGSAARISVDLPSCHSDQLQLSGPIVDAHAGPAGQRLSTPTLSPQATRVASPRHSSQPIPLGSFRSGGAGGGGDGVAGGVSVSAAAAAAEDASSEGPRTCSDRHNMRASVDAAAGAELLATRQASEASEGMRAAAAAARPSPLNDTNGASGGGNDGGQRRPGDRSGSVVPRASTSAPASPVAQPSDWSFSDNLQRARMKARYAALEMMDEICYQALDGDDSDSPESSSHGGRAAAARRRSTGGGAIFGAGPAKQRKPWFPLRLFRAGGGGNGGGGGGRSARAAALRAAAAAVIRTSDDSDGDSTGGGGEEEGAAYEEEDEPLPVEHSRDSRVVYRARVGLDGRPHLLHSRLGNADADAGGDDADVYHDDVDAAVAAAAAVFANAVSAISATGPKGAPGGAAAAAAALAYGEPPERRRRVHFRRPPVEAVHFTLKFSDDWSEDSERGSGGLTFLARLRSQLASLSGTLSKQQMPNYAQLYRLAAGVPPSQPPPPRHQQQHQQQRAQQRRPPRHTASAPQLTVGAGAAGAGGGRPPLKPALRASAGTIIGTGGGGGGGNSGGEGGIGVLTEFSRSFRSRGVVPVEYDDV